jgi:acyl-coenzyme A synthetase/AMP-(fatty) acid ligase
MMENASLPCPHPFNMAAHVLGHADELADKVALAILSNKGARRYHYRDIKRSVLGVARGFLDMGLTAGDRILIRLGNSVEFPLTYLAALAVDMVPVPTSSQLTDGEVQKIIDDVTPALIVRDPFVACPNTTIPILAVDNLAQFYDYPPAEFVYGDPDRLGYIVYTSGTSGRPRAVMHAHRAIWARQMMISDWYDLHQEDRLLHAGAFNWTFTLGTGLMDPWTVGATALIPTAGVDMAMLPLLMKRFDATIFAAAPGVYRRILQGDPQIKLPKLRHALSAGEKLAPRTAASWSNATGTQIYEAFGMSECSTFISASPHRPASSDVLGWPQHGRHITIIDPQTGSPVAANEEGVIAIHRDDPGLMLGYWNSPDETAEKFIGDWFLTGDYGFETPEGAIGYLGRRDDMMNAGGFRVSPIEVETQLLAHPDVETVAVTDVEIKPDTFIIVAFYTAAHDIDAGALSAFCQERLARYKHPRAFVRLDVLPTNPNGKISRSALKNRKDALNG